MLRARLYRSVPRRLPARRTAGLLPHSVLPAVLPQSVPVLPVSATPVRPHLPTGAAALASADLQPGTAPSAAVSARRVLPATAAGLLSEAVLPADTVAAVLLPVRVQPAHLLPDRPLPDAVLLVVQLPVDRWLPAVLSGALLPSTAGLRKAVSGAVLSAVRLLQSGRRYPGFLLRSSVFVLTWRPHPVPARNALLAVARKHLAPGVP